MIAYLKFDTRQSHFKFSMNCFETMKIRKMRIMEDRPSCNDFLASNEQVPC